MTIWNTVSGAIDEDVGLTYAKYAPSLLGMTSQNTGGPLRIFDKLPGVALTCNYCAKEQNVKDHIVNASKDWDGKKPLFIMIQAQPWQDITPTSLLNVARSLDDRYRVVRPDHLMHLLREQEKLGQP